MSSNHTWSERSTSTSFYRAFSHLPRSYVSENCSVSQECSYQALLPCSSSSALSIPTRTLICTLNTVFSRQVADWLVDVGYKYAPLPDPPNPQSLEEAFRLNPHNRPYIPGIAVLLKDIIFSVEKDYVTSPFVFNFEKQNPRRKIQLISSLLSPIQRILGFHSSTSSFLSWRGNYAEPVLITE